ncbi:hypothetical protein GCM10023159_22220 [Brevibacterium yomogidense]
MIAAVSAIPTLSPTISYRLPVYDGGGQAPALPDEPRGHTGRFPSPSVTYVLFRHSLIPRAHKETPVTYDGPDRCTSHRASEAPTALSSAVTPCVRRESRTTGCETREVSADRTEGK